MKLAKRLVGSMLVLVAVALNAAAFASPPQYLINIATLGEFYSSVPFRKDASNPLSVGNGTATFSGHAFAGPGWISSYARQDIQFSSGLSGGGGSTTRSRAQTDDFVISGPPGSVTGTLHFRVKAALAKGGGFDGNGAHQAHLDCTVSANFNNYSGSLAVGNGGISGTGTLAGWSSSTLDKAIDITASFPVGAPLLVYMVLDAVDFTYGNVFVNPGWVETDAGGNSDQYGGAGLKLVEVGGQVMTLPPGYTLNSTNFGVVDNHFTVTSAVNDTPRSPLSLSVFPNPFNPRTTVKYTVPSRGVVAIDVYDAAGAHVATLFHGEKNAGAYSVDWDGRATGEASVSSGVYFARISFNGLTETKKMVLLK